MRGTPHEHPMPIADATLSAVVCCERYRDFRQYGLTRGPMTTRRVPNFSQLEERIAIFWANWHQRMRDVIGRITRRDRLRAAKDSA